MSGLNIPSEASAPKKRFVWPEELHMEMIGAVFESGLKYVEDGREYDFSKNLQNKGREIPLAKIQDFIGKLIVYGNYYLKGKSLAGGISAITDSHIGGDSSSDLQQHSMINLESVDSFGSIDFSQKKEVSDSIGHNTRVMLDDINHQKRKLDTMRQAVASQNSYLKRAKNKVSQQTKLLNQISSEVDTFSKSAMAKVSTLNSMQMMLSVESPLDVVGNDSFTMTSYPLPTSGFSAIDDDTDDQDMLSSANTSPREKNKSGGTSSSMLSYRNELQMISEMRANINVHKQLMAQKQQQISAHMNDTASWPQENSLGGDTSHNAALMNMPFSSEAEQEDNEMLDTELFAFLLDDNTTDGT